MKRVGGKHLFLSWIIKNLKPLAEIIKDWEDGRFSDAVGCLRVKVVLDGNDD